ncbi:pyridoxamine 5'-phosphate oxidase family protein [Acetobacterium malicum]|uniref:pyridoxamine 5'-phosphate oxidase family protein n=1 Tax=Acetobacterium malicum TaxID=52692 RepID=UPI003593F0B7
MNKQEMLELMRSNPAFYLATVDGDQPRVRGMLLFRADENGLVFHSGTMKEVYAQIQNNPKVECCFNDFKNGCQLRVRGQLEIVNDNALKDEIASHPSRAFLKPWKESGELSDFYQTFAVFRMTDGVGVTWTMDTNFAPKVDVPL